ncbi:hypothetical protein [Nocardia stercoris]|uniref:hypothetical protein n=1 Tax=Nocardia stercoris TaxID=2483361 RepID=UPI001F305403|nr:hypothetical protein [Nocardia stercoris]
MLTTAGEKEILPRLIAALIDISGATGNTFFTSIVGGTVHVLAPEHIYTGDGNRPVVMVELKLPNIGLPDPASRAAFVAAATDIVDDLTVAGHERANTWVNVLNALDGGWGIGGVAYTGDALIAAVAAAAEPTAAR